MFLTVLMVMALSTTAFAVENGASTKQQPVPVAEMAVSEDGILTPARSARSLLASGNANFYGDGTLDVYLHSGKSNAYIQAGTGGSHSQGSVIVSVKFPDGNWYELGQIAASADHTLMLQFSYCMSGTYHFLFENSTEDWIQVYANIYG